MSVRENEIGSLGLSGLVAALDYLHAIKFNHV